MTSSCQGGDFGAGFVEGGGASSAVESAESTPETGPDPSTEAGSGSGGSASDVADSVEPSGDASKSSVSGEMEESEASTTAATTENSTASGDEDMSGVSEVNDDDGPDETDVDDEADATGGGDEEEDSAGDDGDEGDNGDEDSGDGDELLILEDGMPSLDIGLPGDESYSDYCPSGQLLTGLEGQHVEGRLVEFQGLCARPIAFDETGQLSLSPAASTPVRGVKDPGPNPGGWSRVCPEHMLLSYVGVHLHRYGISGLAIECARLSLVSDDGEPSLEYSDYEELRLLGQSTAAPRPVICAEGFSAGPRLSFDGYGATKIGVNCRTATVTR